MIKLVRHDKHVAVLADEQNVTITVDCRKAFTNPMYYATLIATAESMRDLLKRADATFDYCYHADLCHCGSCEWLREAHATARPGTPRGTMSA